MTSLKQSEAHSAWNSTCFFLGVCESSEDSENSQHLYPSIFFYSLQLHHRGKRKDLQKLSCSTMVFMCFLFFLCLTS